MNKMVDPKRSHTPPESAEDKRKFRRADIALKARFLNANQQERPCVIINISVGGALLRAQTPPAQGERIILYIDQVGRFEADVVRSDKQTFAVTYEKRRAQNAKTADNLTEIMNRGLRSTERRKNIRIEQSENATIRLEDGRAAECAILDISLTGASLEISPRPPLGSRIKLGRMMAKVVRRHETGVGVVFTGPAARIDDVISEVSTPYETGGAIGARLAENFGKKSPRE